MSRLNILQFDFDQLSPITGYVMISVAIGSKPLPRTSIHNTITSFEKRSKLCKKLRDLGITFDVMPCAVDSFGGSVIQLEETPIAEAKEAKIENNPFSKTLNVSDARKSDVAIRLGQLREQFAPEQEPESESNQCDPVTAKNEAHTIGPCTSKILGGPYTKKSLLKDHDITEQEAKISMDALDGAIKSIYNFD